MGVKTANVESIISLVASSLKKSSLLLSTFNAPTSCLFQYNGIEIKLLGEFFSENISKNLVFASLDTSG
tara:strand:+ start:12446 stop:12652 length:207 start_codon:yes stop_codon:yes gene_type:complete